MLPVAVVSITVGTIIIALLIAGAIYVVGFYLFHLPQLWVAVAAFAVFVLLIVGNVGASA